MPALLIWETGAGVSEIIPAMEALQEAARKLKVRPYKSPMMVVLEHHMERLYAMALSLFPVALILGMLGSRILPAFVLVVAQILVLAGLAVIIVVAGLSLYHVRRAEVHSLVRHADALGGVALELHRCFSSKSIWDDIALSLEQWRDRNLTRASFMLAMLGLILALYLAEISNTGGACIPGSPSYLLGELIEVGTLDACSWRRYALVFFVGNLVGGLGFYWRFRENNGMLHIVQYVRRLSDGGLIAGQCSDEGK